MIPLRERLRRALPIAMKSRDKSAVAAVRSALAAIDNAEAVPVTARAGAIADSAKGPGSAEAVRHELTESGIAAIVAAEITERESAAGQYRDAGQAERADRLSAEANALRRIQDS